MRPSSSSVGPLANRLDGGQTPSRNVLALLAEAAARDLTWYNPFKGRPMLKQSLIAAVLGLVAAAPAQAQSTVASFSDRPRRWTTRRPHKRGSLYDITARLLSRYMGKYIPGNPTLVARNMTGAAGLRLANWLYQQGPKDGTAVATFARGIAFDALLGQGRARFFDATKFNWIGSANDEVTICVAWHTTGITSFEEL